MQPGWGGIWNDLFLATANQKQVEELTLEPFGGRARGKGSEEQSPAPGEPGRDIGSRVGVGELNLDEGRRPQF